MSGEEQIQKARYSAKSSSGRVVGKPVDPFRYLQMDIKVKKAPALIEEAKAERGIVPKKAKAAKKAPLFDKRQLHSEALELLAAVKKGDKLGLVDAQMLGSEGLALKIRGVISTRIPSFDLAIGRGGFPLGRLSVLTGGEGGGKTTIALHACAEAQARGGLAIYCDREFKLDPDYARGLGVNLEDLMVIRPRTLEDFVDQLLKLIASIKKIRQRTGRRTPILFVLDSLNALKAKSVVEDEAGKHHVAAEARKWSEHLPEIIAQAHHEDIALVFISQIRKKIGVMFGSSDDIAGGEAVRFFASIIAKVTYIGSDKKSIKGTDKKVRCANKLEIILNKNQIAPPFKTTEILMSYGTGVHRSRSLITACAEEEIGLVRVDANTWYDHNGEVIGVGLRAAAKALDADKARRIALNKAFRAKAGWSVPA